MDIKNIATHQFNRRGFLIGAVCGLAAAPFSAVFGAAALATLKPLDPKGPQASALKYTMNFKDAAGSKSVQRCVNCKLFKPDGGCQIFPGSSVAKDGWCSAWVSVA